MLMVWGHVSKFTTFIKNFLPELAYFIPKKGKKSWLRLAHWHESKAVCFLKRGTTAKAVVPLFTNVPREESS